MEFLLQGIAGGAGELGRHLVEAVQGAPEDEVPGRAVPDTADHHGEEKVAKVPRLAHPAAAQGDIEVIPEPGTQGDMPSPPEIADAGGKVGGVEVFQQADAQQLGKAQGHAGVAAEIQIDLQGVGEGGGDEFHGTAGIDVAEHRVHKDAQPVGQYQFLEQPPQNGHQPGAQPVDIPDADFLQRPELGQQGIGPLDGALDELGEEGGKEGIGQKVFLGRLFAAVDVHQVPHQLEAVEGDAHRHDQMEQGLGGGFGQQREQRPGQAGPESVIFEEEQRGEGQHQTQHQPPAPGGRRPALDEQTGCPGDGGGIQQHCQRNAGKGRAEKIPGAQQPQAAQLAGHQQVAQKDQRKKQEKEQGSWLHGVHSFLNP